MPSPRRYQGIVVICILLVISFFILSLTFQPSHESHFCRKTVLETVSPIQRMISSLFSAVGSVWQNYIFLVDMSEKNKKLSEDNAALLAKINECREMALENKRLRNLLNLQETTNVSTVAANVVRRYQSSVFETLLINKGTRDGLEPGLPVIVQGGIVGRIIEASWSVSKVLLIIDYNSNIDALLQKSRTRGVLQGYGDSRCKLKYVQRSEEVGEGDIVVSSGLAGVFPKGLILGTVISVNKGVTGLFQEIEVSPMYDIRKVEEVLVVLKKEAGK